MSKNKNKSLLARLALFFATLIWGSSFVIVKNTVEVLPVFFLLAVRFSIAFLVLAIIFAKRLKQIDKKYLWQGGIIGLCIFFAYATQTFGITDTTPGKNAFLTAIYCVIVPFLFWITDKSKPDFFNILAAFLSVLGIGLVSLKSDLSICKGDLLTILGGFFFAAHIVAIKRFSKGHDPVLLTIVQFAYCSIFSLICTLIFEARVTQIKPDMIGGILYLSIGCTAIGILLQSVGQKYTTPSAAAIILSLESVFGVLFSILLAGELMSKKLVFGFCMIFISVIISETKLEFLFPKKKESQVKIK
ncbi:MAG: DMT family transporter [Clostridia bacterium]|nr:DMT family transporter [Clostridia bacterium]